MLKNESSLWDAKYARKRTYSSTDDVFIFAKTNPTVLAIDSYIKDGAAVLEVGSGTGELISYVQSSHPNCKTTGLDFSSSSIEKSRQVANDFGIATDFVQGDIRAMPFPDECFDVVFGDQVIGHTVNIDMALREIFRVTKRGGIVALSIANSMRPDGWYLNKTLSHTHEGYTQKSMFPWMLAHHVRRAGFVYQKMYGDMLFLMRNIALIRALVMGLRGNEEQRGMLPTAQHQSTSQSRFKRFYRSLDSSVPSWAKVTIGVVAQKPHSVNPISSPHDTPPRC